MFNYVANILTFLSLIFGFVSIIFSLENHFTFASWAIIISVALDGLDGQVARKNPLHNEFGKELDSLVDVVSFGIAPSVLGYIFVYRDFYLLATIALFIYLACSVMRLAKYNITPKEELTSYFYGLPTTASGGFLASFILIYRRYTRLPSPYIFLVLVLLLAFLMVSKIKYLNLDGIRQIFRKNIAISFVIIAIVALVLLGGCWVASIFLPEAAIFSLFSIYLIFAPFMVKSVEIRYLKE
ncbi:MAG: CDP-diacylglycerol--serine O-phosphatidyltransferase [Candidatus Omnitrophica bacterium]|nr:CDP-diacylglycerol--serine O-phosphatidyltransferase [Candidatus Omnitrophota bacterium]